MIEYKEEKKRMFFMGSELASFYVKYPHIEGREVLNSLLSQLVTSSISWVVEQLFPMAREEYEGATEVNKRSPQKPYRYTLQILADEVGTEYRIKLTAMLCRGRNEEMKRYEEELVFDADSELVKKPTKEKKRNGA